MTERPEVPSRADESSSATPPGTAGEAGRRPSPGPSATSRARRASAAGVEVRRPSPRPAAAPTANGAASDGEVTSAAPPSEARPARAPASEVRPADARGSKARPAPAPAFAEALPYQATAGQAGERRRPPVWLAILLAVLVLAGAAALVVVLRLPSGAGSVEDRDRALSAAKTEVPLILSYDYRSFDAGVAKAKAELTGRAVTDYTTAMAKTIKPTAIKVKAVVQAQTDGAGVESVSPDGRQVTVVVFGEQKVTNSSLAAPRTDLFRVRATLNLVGGQWLVSKFDQI